MQILYGPPHAAAYWRRVHHELGDEAEPLGSGEDLKLFWNVAVSNVIQPSDMNWLPVHSQGKEVLVRLEPGGLMLPSKEQVQETAIFKSSNSRASLEY